MLPLRVGAKMPDVPDDVFTLPEITVPQDMLIPGVDTNVPSTPLPTGGGPVLPPSPVDQLFAKYGSVPVVDIIGQLPTAPQNTPSPAEAKKNSVTVHWVGDSVQAGLTDDDMLSQITTIANEHINKDWGGGFGGSGIMYHEVIAPSGTVFMTRAYDDVLWHCGDYTGNLYSRAILVFCAADTPANEVQLFRLLQRKWDFKLPMHPHSFWSATQCPGDQLRAYIPTIP